MNATEAIRRQRIGDHQGAIKIYQSILEQVRSPEIAHNMAMAFAAINDWEQAEAAYRLAIKWEPNRWQSRNNLAIRLQAEGKLFAAEAQWRSALASHPNRLELHQNLGSLLYLQGRHDEAASLLTGALREKPINAMAWFNLGVCYRDMGRLRQAEECFNHCIQQDPGHTEAYLELGGLALNQSSLDEAIDLYRRGLAIDSQHPKMRFHLGVALSWRKMGDGTEFLESLPTQCRPWLDSWEHLQTIRTEETELFGTMSLGMDKAIQAVELDGLFIELGVRFGTSATLIHEHSGEPVYGFDTFEGLPEDWHDTPKASYSAGGYVPQLAPDIHLYKGLFKDTLNSFIGDKRDPVALLHVDCDLYSSTITALNILSPHLSSGSIVVFDEYYMNPYWKEDEHRAWLEFIEERQDKVKCIGVCFHSYQASFKML